MPERLNKLVIMIMNYSIIATENTTIRIMRKKLKIKANARTIFI